MNVWSLPARRRSPFSRPEHQPLTAAQKFSVLGLGSRLPVPKVFLGLPIGTGVTYSPVAERVSVTLGRNGREKKVGTFASVQLHPELLRGAGRGIGDGHLGGVDTVLLQGGDGSRLGRGRITGHPHDTGQRSGVCGPLQLRAAQVPAAEVDGEAGHPEEHHHHEGHPNEDEPALIAQSAHHGIFGSMRMTTLSVIVRDVPNSLVTKPCVVFTHTPR